jgi:GT2 family glycosyltransferase
MYDISIIIVNYNSGVCISNCVDSIVNHITCRYEIIVLDNNSTDKSIDMLEQSFGAHPLLKIIKSTDNTGFAKGNNIACEQAQGKILHFLNPDTIVNKELDEEYNIIISKNDEAVYVTGLCDENNIPVQTTYALPLFSNYFRRLFSPKKTLYWSIGASIIMPATVFEKIGRWPSDYFMYTEDMDMFYRIHLFKIPVIHTATRIIHIGKVSSGNTWSNFQRALQIEKSLRTFYTKYRIKWQYHIMRPLQFVYMVFKNREQLPTSVKAYIKLLFA